jgi:hypothetical protein
MSLVDDALGHETQDSVAELDTQMIYIPSPDGGEKALAD